MWRGWWRVQCQDEDEVLHGVLKGASAQTRPFLTSYLFGRPQTMTAPCISSTVAMETMPGIGMRIITKISIEFVKPDRRKKLLEDYELPLYFRWDYLVICLSRQDFTIILQGRFIQVLWRGKATPIPMDCHRASKVESYSFIKLHLVHSS